MKHFWPVYQNSAKGSKLLTLLLGIANLSSSYQRTNLDKGQTFKRALGFFVRHVREGEGEARYNLARALGFMGLNENATEIYESLCKDEACSDEIKTLSSFNHS